MKLQGAQAELLLSEAQWVTELGLNKKVDPRVWGLAQAILDMRLNIACDFGGSFEVPRLEAVQADEKIVAFLEGKPVKKRIYVPGKLVNLVV